MRVFKPSPLTLAESPLMPPSPHLLLSMQGQAPPSIQRLLKLGVGIGGMLNAFCLAGIASPLPDSVSQYVSLNAAKQALNSQTTLDSAKPESVSSTEWSPTPAASDWPRFMESKTQLKPVLKPQLKRPPQIEPNSAFENRSTVEASFIGNFEPVLNKPVLNEPVSKASLEIASEAISGADAERFPQGADVSEWMVWPDRAIAPPSSTVHSLAHLCKGLERCEQQPTLSLNAASATVSDSPVAVEEVTRLAQTNRVQLDEELGIIRVNQQRSRQDEELGIIRATPLRSRDSDLGILRLMQRAAAKPAPPKQPSAFLIGRLGYLNSDNIFREAEDSISDQIYQSGLSFYAVPALSENTSLYAIAETNLVRFENGNSYPNRIGRDSQGIGKDLQDEVITRERKNPSYNEVELQIGIRQKLLPRTYAQIGLRNQSLYSRGYQEKMLGINYIDTLISHRAILDSKTWLDAFYQAKLGFASDGTSKKDSDRASRLRQTLTLSLNHGFTKDLRTSLVYQLDFEDYTQTVRSDFYQQLLAVISFSATPESRFTLFGGTRFGRSSDPDIDLEDTFYGAGLTVNLPLF